ncbi:MAG TPA: glycosyltransferase [Oligoflexia bacterium]|mgnify:CR=1 FL=1|nr:glycosyltransferase [Oligoflexia bacterium]HMP47641.1 glycosyltransferase [Oligoflexia bacterium]
MDSSLKQDDLKIRMKSEWDERIRHDYRYWMSDGVENDQEMWLTGERDFDLVTEGISDEFIKEARVLDLACGVGRLTRRAATRSMEVIGIDVSEEAVRAASEFLDDFNNVRILLGDGISLRPIMDQQFELVISFASLGSMPARVLANYLSEIARVLVPGGQVRIQVYLGKEQEIAEEDTLALRSYERERFLSALASAGFDLNYIREVVLPFEVSDYQNGVIAYVVGGERNNESPADPDYILQNLLAKPEKNEGIKWTGSRTAYLVALARASQHVKAGHPSKAREALNLALNEFQGDVSEAKELLKEIGEIEYNTSSGTEINDSGKSLKSPSLSVISDSGSIFDWIETKEGRVLQYKGVCLSHKISPKKASISWAKRTINSFQSATGPVLLIGAGDLHFAIALREMSGRDVIILETELELLNVLPDLAHSGFKIVNNIEALDSIIRSYWNNNYPELVILPAAPFYSGETVSHVRRKISANKLMCTLSPQIAVVGPLCGGTLPIAEYIHRGLASMSQRSSYINLAPYFQSFNSFSSYLKKSGRKDKLENKYVELLSDLVLEIVDERGIDILISVAQAPLSPEVLERCRERGVITAHWFMEDTRRFPTWREIAKYYDYFFIIQKGESIEEVRAAGGRRVSYLPLACDPVIHTGRVLSPSEIREYGSSVSFVGAGYNNRRHVFSKMIRPDFKIWGTEWPNVIPFSTMVQRSGARVSVEDYVKIFSASKINLNLHSSQERDGVDPSGDFVNPRTFELAACKAFQLVDNRSLMSELFREDEVATFSNEKEMKEKIEYFLERPEERSAIIEKAYKRVISEHTYQHRLNSMLEHIYEDFGDHLQKRSNNDEWQRTLVAASADDELKDYLMKAKDKGADPVLEDLVAPLVNSRGVLTEVEQKLLLLNHMRGQITQINRLRNPNGS